MRHRVFTTLFHRLVPCACSMLADFQVPGDGQVFKCYGLAKRQQSAECESISLRRDPSLRSGLAPDRRLIGPVTRLRLRPGGGRVNRLAHLPASVGAFAQAILRRALGPNSRLPVALCRCAHGPQTRRQRTHRRGRLARLVSPPRTRRLRAGRHWHGFGTGCAGGQRAGGGARLRRAKAQTATRSGPSMGAIRVGPSSRKQDLWGCCGGARVSSPGLAPFWCQARMREQERAPRLACGETRRRAP